MQIKYYLALVQLIVTRRTVNGNAIEIYINKHPSRIFPNVSFGLEKVDENSHQCSNKVKRTQHRSGKADYMSFSPNRRLQNETLLDAWDQNLQLGIILALGGHSNQHYDYGPFGSLNGLMSVWDSWADNFFPQVSNTSSIVLLFDERDFRRQNYTK